MSHTNQRHMVMETSTSVHCMQMSNSSVLSIKWNELASLAERQKLKSVADDTSAMWGSNSNSSSDNLKFKYKNDTTKWLQNSS